MACSLVALLFACAWPALAVSESDWSTDTSTNTSTSNHNTPARVAQGVPTWSVASYYMQKVFHKITVQETAMTETDATPFRLPNLDGGRVVGGEVVEDDTEFPFAALMFLYDSAGRCSCVPACLCICALVHL